MDSAEIRELKAACFETLMFFPGIDRTTWLSILLKEYTEEVVDALGSDPEEVTSELIDWWDNMVYVDEITEIGRRYCEWAKIFRDQKGVDFYRELVAEAVKSKEQQ